ncbi:hypothetical protein D3C84_800180 [compost metagenome]
MTGIGRQLFAQSLDGFVVGIQGFDFIQQALLHLRDFGRLDAMFARHGVNRVETLFQILEARGVGIEIVEKAV